MSSDKKADRFWDRIAKRYDKGTRNDEGLDRAAARAAKLLGAEDTVLDFACGTGVVSFKIAADVKEVHAIDTSAGMIAVAKERARESEVANVRFEETSIFDEGLARASYDAVLAFNILHLLEDAPATVRRAADLLKPEGLLISTTPCIGESGAVLRTLVPLIRKVVGLSYLRRLRTSEVKELVQEAGFRILQSEVGSWGKIRLVFVAARKR